MKSSNKNKSTMIDFDYFSKSLYTEARIFLGDEFSKLPLRIQTGYIKVFYFNQNLTRNNRHLDDTDSFAMGTERTKRYFGDPQVFCNVNANGYYLRPKEGKHGVIQGKYVTCKKGHDLAKEFQPTEWLVKTKYARQTSINYGVQGFQNGYKLSKKVLKLLTIWQVKLKNNEYDDPDLDLIDGKLKSIYENKKLQEGAIIRDKTIVDKSININLMVDINLSSLNMYKALLERICKYFQSNKINIIKEGDKSIKKIEEEVKRWSFETQEGDKEATQDKEALGTPKRHLSNYMAVKHLFSRDIEESKVLGQLGEIERILNYTRELKSPIMPVIYEERGTGRYFAKYGALQGYRKSVRYAALQGRYEYDIEAAHQNILIEIFNRKTVTFEELNIVKNYIVSKDDIRNRLAKELDIPKSLVKTIITGLTYGSKLINNSKYSIYKDCKGDQVIIERILSNDWLKSLEAVFKKTVKHLIGSRTIIKNAVGIIRPLKEIDSSKGMNKSQAVAHILQGHEREILDVIIANYNRDTISLLLHDCVVFNGQLDSQEISRIVKENTNFTLSFKEGSY